jgi:hypothetical protein
MFVWLRNFMLSAALLCAIGGHLAILQSVAWATMFASHARTESLQSAVDNTFDGRHLCPLCRQIAKARESERKTDLQASLKQTEFLSDRATYFVSPPSIFQMLPSRAFTGQVLPHAPPVPPPRFFNA